MSPKWLALLPIEDAIVVQKYLLVKMRRTMISIIIASRYVHFIISTPVLVFPRTTPNTGPTITFVCNQVEEVIFVIFYGENFSEKPIRS